MPTDEEVEEGMNITHADCINISCPGAVDVITCCATDCPIIKERKEQ